MNNFKKQILNKIETTPRIINVKETQEIFLKRIAELDSKKQELLLKLYAEITKDVK